MPSQAEGLLDGTSKPYCGIKKVPKGKHRGTMNECLNQVRYYGLNKVDKSLLDAIKTTESKAKYESKKQVNKKTKKKPIKKQGN